MDIEKTEKTYSFSCTPDDPEKLKQLFDRLRRNVSVIEIKTKSGTEAPDRIIFNGNSYIKRNECKRLPDYSGSYVTVHKVIDGGTHELDFGFSGARIAAATSWTTRPIAPIAVRR